jgi:hypothetical protein
MVSVSVVSVYCERALLLCSNKLKRDSTNSDRSHELGAKDFMTPTKRTSSFAQATNLKEIPSFVNTSPDKSFSPLTIHSRSLASHKDIAALVAPPPPPLNHGETEYRYSLDRTLRWDTHCDDDDDSVRSRQRTPYRPWSLSWEKTNTCTHQSMVEYVQFLSIINGRRCSGTPCKRSDVDFFDTGDD